jgi:GNAT superfamily N-acetyltransferase
MRIETTLRKTPLRATLPPDMHDVDPLLSVQRVPLPMILSLRHRVLRAGLPPESAIFEGDSAESTAHLAVLLGTMVIGCASLHLNTWEKHPAFQLRGMAVEPDFQGAGIGSLLLKEIDRVAASAFVNQLWCNARTPAIAFYEKHGWQVVSEVFQIPTAGPHVRMIKRL